ncbi:uncharacterized protein LOC126889290 [Diabrotica virgifera virgifera]|uniref:Major facilitator superfamily (MFS) profile domain-containing protein n=1 Tax=Diabrotica virgifera virgifera TaxID=50390 RepID=A0ABM5KT54_DIAVI|nr:uncharacterized protein LOC126889290 [Diabrotica virgifera virgifera]
MDYTLEKVKNDKDNEGKTDQLKHKADFEEAVVATGFGKFNIYLLMLLIPSSFAQAFEQMGLSYAVPIAECDLNLTLERKGLLTAVSFGGMITSGIFMGILSDIFGRRKLILWGYFLNGLANIVAAMSQNFLMLMIAKFFCGLIFNGPFSASTTLLTEYHASQYRSKVQLFRGVTFALGFFILPLVAWAILPLHIEYEMFGFIKIHSWNIFILCSSMGTFLSAIGFWFIPESPKYLMAYGKNTEALAVFQKVYRWNTGKTNKDYPIKALKEELEATIRGTQKRRASVQIAVNKFFVHLKPLFKPPVVFHLILACTMSYMVMMSGGMLKYWLPQILQYSNSNEFSNNSTTFSVCNMINTLAKPKIESSEVCRVVIKTSVYKNALIIAGPEVLIFALSGLVVSYFGKKKLIAILCIISSASAIGLYFAPNSTLMITLFGIYIPFVDLAAIFGITITLEVFATHFRTLAVSFHLMSARLGSITANMLFSSLVATGCITPFAVCCILTATISFLTFLYPNTENRDLE